MTPERSAVGRSRDSLLGNEGSKILKANRPAGDAVVGDGVPDHESPRHRVMNRREILPHGAVCLLQPLIAAQSPTSSEVETLRSLDRARHSFAKNRSRLTEPLPHPPS